MTDAKNWKIGLSTGWQGKADRETFEFYAQNGIENIEVSMGHDRFLELDWDEVGKSAKEFGIGLWSVHLPFMPYKQVNFGDTEGPAREYTVQMAKNAIDRMGELGIKHLVIHSGVDFYAPDRESCMKAACGSLADIAEYGAPKGVTVCVENMPRTGLGNTIEEMKRLVASHPALRVCFDTNHLLRNRHVDFVRELGDKIVTLHVSDYDFHDERHVLPYEGEINWIDVVNELEKAGYNGVWMYECGLGERKAVIRERPVTAADLKENHRCLISKQPWQSFCKWDEEFCKSHTFIEDPSVYHGEKYKMGLIVMTNAKNWKLGLSSCCLSGAMGVADIFKAYADNGIEYMELSYGHLDKYFEIDWDVVKESMAKCSKVKVWSFHMPFGPFSKINLATFDKDKLNYTVELYKNCIDRIAELGIKLAVVHPSGEPNKPEDREALLEIASDALAELAAYAAPKGVTIAVEDIPRTCLGNRSDEIKKLISKHPALRVCFDTNHLLDERNVDFIRALGDKIVTLHVSDYDFCNERHWLPYEGKVDWVELVTALEDAGYNGVWMYEIGFKAPKSIDRDRDLTFEDFKENHQACINKLPLKPLGTPNHEGCMAWTYYTEPKIN